MLLLFLLLSIVATISLSAAQRREQIPQPDTLAYQAKTIVVTGTRAETMLERAAVRVELISGERAQGTAISTVGELLREQPGLLIAPGSVRTGVQMMGLSPDYTLILIDGQPLTGRVGGVLDLERVSVGNIERVEVVRGPLSSLYGGDALAGVINIITRRPESGWHGRIFGRYLNRGNSELQAEQLYGSDELEISLYGVARRAAAFEVVDNSARYPYPASTDYTLSGRVRWLPHTTFRAIASARLFTSTTRGNLLQAQAGDITTVNGSLAMLDRSLTTGIEWFTPAGRITAQLYGTSYHEGYTFIGDSNGGSEQNDSFERRTGRAFVQFDRIISLRNRVMAGFELLLDDAQGSRYTDRPFYRTVAAFAQWEGNPLDRISYALSLRSDWTSAFGTPRSVLFGGLPVLPRLSIRYALSSQVALTATVGEGFRAPDMRQLYIRFSPAGAGYQLLGARTLGLDLRPEQSLSMMAGITFTFDSLALGRSTLYHGLFDVLVFFNRVRNLIEYFAYQQQPLVFTYRNVAAVQTYGVLLSASTSWRLGEQRLSVQASYQWLAAYDERVLDAIARGTAGYLIPATGEFRRLRPGEYYGLWYRPFHSGTLRLGWDVLPLELRSNLRVQYIGAFGDLQRAATPDIYDGTRYLGQVLDSPKELVPGYWVINLGVEKSVPLGLDSPSVAIAVGVNNVLDVSLPRYVPSMIGRQFFCSIAVGW